MDDPELRLLVDRMVERWWDATVKAELIVVPAREEEAKRSLKEKIVQLVLSLLGA